MAASSGMAKIRSRMARRMADRKRWRGAQRRRNKQRMAQRSARRQQAISKEGIASNVQKISNKRRHNKT